MRQILQVIKKGGNTFNNTSVTEIDDISAANLCQYATDLQALFINILWDSQRDNAEKQMKELMRIDINENLMKNGIVFIWSDKRFLSDINEHMESQGFKYIENICICELQADESNSDKAVSLSGDQKLQDIFVKQPSQFFNTSKRIILMYRRVYFSF